MTPLPIYAASPAKELAPHTYVIHKFSQLCRCGSLHEFSKLYGKTHLKSRMGQKYITNLRPVHTPNDIAYNLPIEIVTMPLEHLLFCHECVSATTLSHLPSPPAPTKEDIASKLTAMGLVRHPTPRTKYVDKHGNVRLEDAEQPKKVKDKSPKWTVDDL